MQRYLAVASLLFLVILVLWRAFQLKKLGIKAILFGERDRKDFFILPFMLPFFYMVIISLFDSGHIGTELFKNARIAWVGVIICVVGILLFVYATVGFGKSFIVGIDEKNPRALITSGAFSMSRNPIYTAFLVILMGIFLIIPNWIILIYLVMSLWLFNRQIDLEEQSLKKLYGKKYDEYCKRVRRFL